jgi:hypothetical protein
LVGLYITTTQYYVIWRHSRLIASLHEKSKSLSVFKPTAVRGKWIEVNNHNHLATDALQKITENVDFKNSAESM